MSITQAVTALFIACIVLLPAFIEATAAPPGDPLPSPAAQAVTGMTKQLYLLPAEDSPVQLQTHTANLYVTDNGDGSVSVFMDAVYRVKNDTDEAVPLPLILYPGIGSSPPQDVSLTVGGQLLPLGPAAGGGLASQVDLPADSQVTLRLRYSVTVDESPLVTVRYAPAVLRRWRGPTSTRIEYSLPNSIVRESWTQATPDTWSYAASTSDTTAIKWLFDSAIPNEEFIVQFVAPNTWTQIQNANASTGTGGPASSYLAQGDLYRNLAEAEPADRLIRERFEAQAIAAYSDGITQHSSTPGADVAQIHIRLAALYRDRAARPAHDTVPYSALMIDEASAALSLLEPNDGRRAELQRWLADGLRILFDDARTQNDWQKASQVIDQMDMLPPGTVDAALIEEGRQIVLVQQALQLLRRGEQEAAVALVGEEITAGSASAPLASQPIFAAWYLTVTAEPDIIALDIRAIPVAGREAEAQANMDDMATAWLSEIARSPTPDVGWTVSPVTRDSTSGGLRVRVEMPASMDGELLAGYVPEGANYVLLKSMLSQLSPQRQEQTRFFQREVQRSQPMDLRAAGDQWYAMAADLDRQAAEFRTDVAVTDARTQLLTEIQAANYQNTAEAWRDLAQDSWLLFQFQAEDVTGTNDQMRAWYATATSSPTVFSVQTQSVDTNLAWGMALAVLAVAVGLSGLLWWLM